MTKLMIVDDELEICDFVRSFFSERDFEVYTAHNGEEALNIADAKHPDIILLDLKMPGLDGMSTLKEMRRRKKGVKVIMVTAVEDAEKAEEARRYGVIEYITKPLSLEQLEQTVFAAAGRKAHKIFDC
jgi:DNA-binding response OmpR family regulator